MEILTSYTGIYILTHDFRGKLSSTIKRLQATPYLHQPPRRAQREQRTVFLRVSRSGKAADCGYYERNCLHACPIVRAPNFEFALRHRNVRERPGVVLPSVIVQVDCVVEQGLCKVVLPMQSATTSARATAADTAMPPEVKGDLRSLQGDHPHPLAHLRRRTRT